MDGSASKPGNTTRGVGLVKAAVNLYGNRNIADVNSPSLKKDFSTKHSSKAKELHRASNDIVRYEETKWAAESAKAQAEAELSNAKQTVKDLFSMIGESIYKAKAEMRDMAPLKKYVKPSKNDNEYSQVMRELEHAKRELFHLKLDVASVLEEKLRAEKEIEASRSSMLSFSRVAQKLRKEIEEASEEQVVVELARMDALNELRDIEALENTRSKLKEAIEEIDESKELEMKLATTLSDIDMLKNELKFVKKTGKRVLERGGESMEHIEEDQSRDVGALEATKEEIEAAKKELASIREQGFKFMASMDITRNELKHVSAATIHLKKTESKSGAKVRNLSYKLLRAKSKLEAVSAAEEKAKSIVSNLSQTLDKLKSEREAAKKEKEIIINGEVEGTKEEIKKALLEIKVSEERFKGAVEELEAVKSAEAIALEKLKILTENAMKERISNLAKPSSLIIISKCEYEYLRNHAGKANEIAEKKVEAAKAWVEAVRAREKEIVMKTKRAGAEAKAKEKLVVSKRDINNELELENWSKKRDKYEHPSSRDQRKSIKSEASLTPSRGSNSKFHHKLSSPHRPVSPFIVKKKKKVIPNWTKIFRGKKKPLASNTLSFFKLGNSIFK